MQPQKQVDRAHYDFAHYMSKARWASVWHQLDEVQKLQPEDVLEVGPGSGLFKVLAKAFGIRVETLDFDPELNPDHIGSATALPFPDNSYDLVCAFQVLEHLPYEQSLMAFAEMVRVSRRSVVISLPDARPVWPYKIHFPKFGTRDFLVPRPILRRRIHEFDGEHYWELNKLGYSLAKVIADLSREARLVRSYRVSENPNHRFLVFAAMSARQSTSAVVEVLDSTSQE